MRKSLEDKIKKIKMIAMDVDGVLTGGEIIFVNGHEEIKIWNVKDRLGFALAHRTANLKLCWITGRESKEVARCAAECQIDSIYQKATKKKEAYADLKAKYRLKDEEIAFLGDDLIDIPILRQAGLAICPADCPQEVKKEVDLVTKAEGGQGVFREVIELIIKTQGNWVKVCTRYYEEGE
ncbi:MAG: HAD hydrolase family protein [Elusimicrobia bacterium]|nr:HAD hydrolase family protein [Elusimicrobiota bacterium]